MEEISNSSPPSDLFFFRNNWGRFKAKPKLAASAAVNSIWIEPETKETFGMFDYAPFDYIRRYILALPPVNWIEINDDNTNMGNVVRRRAGSEVSLHGIGSEVTIGVPTIFFCKATQPLNSGQSPAQKSGSTRTPSQD
jgi:hypothetical protein